MASTIRSCAVNVDGEPFPKAAQSAGMDAHELAPAGDAYLGLVPTVWYPRGQLNTPSVRVALIVDHYTDSPVALAASQTRVGLRDRTPH